MLENCKSGSTLPSSLINGHFFIHNVDATTNNLYVGNDNETPKLLFNMADLAPVPEVPVLYPKNVINQIEVPITSAANAATDTVLATVADNRCVIVSIILVANDAQTEDLTSCAIFGGLTKVVEFISDEDAIQANLDTAGDQITWEGKAVLYVGDTISMVHVGTGDTALDLTAIIEYYPLADGGNLI